MDESRKNAKVDDYFKKATNWKAECEKLRMILLDSPLTEELKWGKPCYTFEGKNVVLIHGFKEYCALLFINGALLKDTGKILVQQTENVQAARQIRFTNLNEITGMEPIVKDYVQEAIELEKSGLTVELKKSTDFTIPEELQSRFDDNPALKAAFEGLTPGRQRAYMLYFSEPKQAKTRASRIDKCAQQIINGKGLND